METRVRGRALLLGDCWYDRSSEPKSLNRTVKDERLIKPLDKRDPAVATIVTAWRRLTTPRGESIGSGEPGVVACSGGADSSALVLALGSVTKNLVVAHVIHDFRSREDAEKDRDAAKRLAASMGLPFAEAKVRVACAKGNGEANGRKARYQCLLEIARRTGCRFVATGHQGFDQLETVLMRLLRGTGPAGLRGIAWRRKLREQTFKCIGGECDRLVETVNVPRDLAWGSALGPEAVVRVIRPMLGVDGVESKRLCTLAGWVWCEDATNADLTRMRANIRHTVVPALLKMEPDSLARAMALAKMFGGVESLLRERVRRLWKQRVEERDGAGRLVGMEFDRKIFEPEQEVVIAHLFRRVYRTLKQGQGMDKLKAVHIGEVVGRVKWEKRQGAAEFQWPGVRVWLSPRRTVKINLVESVKRPMP